MTESVYRQIFFRRVAKAMREAERRKQAQDCQCRPGSPDTCPKCTDMETGEKYADQDVAGEE